VFALDTNTLIYFFKGEGDVAKHLLATPPTQVAVPTIVLYELYVGIARSSAPSRRAQQLQGMIDLVTILEFSASAAKESAEIRAALEHAGTPIGPIDTLIAGIARTNNAVLVTRNEREFSRVNGLKVVNWY
jgi:tRNA(fMet)-specific endonuclease VapC